MSFTVEPHLSKAEIFQKGEQECVELADTLRNLKCLYVDPEFPPNAQSLGNICDVNGNIEFENFNDPWHTPEQFMRERGGTTWQIWNDPRPFHVTQGRMGNCWLISALQAIAQRPKLLEQIMPKRQYTKDHGIVQVRLFVENEWKVIKIDYHLPQTDGAVRCAPIHRNQFWVPFLEKAYAKVVGTYGALIGGSTNNAFKCLTGVHAKYHWLKEDMDLEKLWEDLIVWHSSGFLLAAGTPDLTSDPEKKKKIFDELQLQHNHSYSILDFKDHNGHHLIKMANPTFALMTRWNGKWSHLLGYDYEDFEHCSLEDRVSSLLQVFWMEIDDFARHFQCLHLCEYREGWHERRYKQVVQRKNSEKCQIVRLNLIARQEYVIEVETEKKNGRYICRNMFINIHKATENEECGELLHSFDDFDLRVGSAPFHLEPGAYFVVLFCFEEMNKLNLQWIFRSPTPINPSSIEFVFCPYSTLLRSIQQMILSNGQAEKNDQIIIYKWFGKSTFLMMVDNLKKWSYARIKVTETKAKDDPDNVTARGGSLRDNSWWPVPPGKRSIIARMCNSRRRIREDEISYEYCISSWLRAYLNWIEALAVNVGFESTSLISVNS